MHDVEVRATYKGDNLRQRREHLCFSLQDSTVTYIIVPVIQWKNPNRSGTKLIVMT